MATDIEALLGDEAESLLTHTCKGVTADELNLPGPDYIDRVFLDTDRPIPVVRNLATLYQPRPAGRDRLPVDPPRGPGHRALRRGQLRQEPRLLRPRQPGASWPSRRRPRASPPPWAASGVVARRYAHRIPFIVKLNHNEFLHYPNQYDQVMFGSVRQAADLGAVGVGATIYFGSEESDRQIQEVRAAFAEAHELGLFTVLWCYLRNPAFKTNEADYHVAGRPHRPGQPHRRHHRGRPHQAEAAREQRGLQRPEVRQDRPARLRAAHDRPPHRPHPLAGRSTATRAASASSTPAASPRVPTTWPRPCAPRSSTSGRVGPGLIVGRKAFQRPMADGRRAAPRRAGRLPRRRGHHRLGKPPVSGSPRRLADESGRPGPRRSGAPVPEAGRWRRYARRRRVGARAPRTRWTVGGVDRSLDRGPTGVHRDTPPDHRARPGGHPVRRRLRRRDAADGHPVHVGELDVRERHRHPSRLPGGDPGARGHAGRRVGLPGPHLGPRHPHARRPTQRARGHEPRRPQDERGGGRRRRHGHRQRRRLRRAGPREGGTTPPTPSPTAAWSATRSTRSP